MTELWQHAIVGHHITVQQRVVAAVDELVAEGGLLNLSMAAVAARAGLGRATLYRHFESLDHAVAAWQEHKITAHLRAVREAAEAPGSSMDRLEETLKTYALLAGHATHAGSHPPPLVVAAHAEVAAILTPLLGALANDGLIRRDTSATELASFCAAALGPMAAGRTRASAHRAVRLVLDALRTSDRGT